MRWCQDWIDFFIAAICVRSNSRVVQFNLRQNLVLPFDEYCRSMAAERLIFNQRTFRIRCAGLPSFSQFFALPSLSKFHAVRKWDERLSFKFAQPLQVALSFQGVDIFIYFLHALGISRKGLRVRMCWTARCRRNILAFVNIGNWNHPQKGRY